MNITETVGKVAVSFDPECECLRIQYGSFLGNSITLIEYCTGDDPAAGRDLLDYFKRLAAVPFKVDDDG